MKRTWGRHKRTGTLIGATLIAGFLLAPTAAAPAFAEDTAQWKAVLDVSSPNYTGIDTLFSALGSHDLDPRGLTFQYDFDGDGTFDLTTDRAQAKWRYSVPGTYTARLLVTDEYLLTASTTATVVVVGIEQIGAPLAPEEGAPELEGVRLSVKHAPPQGEVRLTLPKTLKSERVSARLVRASAGSPWFKAPVEAYGPFDSKIASFQIGADIKPGKYDLLITTESGLMTSTGFTVDKSAANITVPVVGGVLVTIILAALITALRIRKIKSSARGDDE